MVEPYYDDIEMSAIDNVSYRDVMYTDKNIQIVLMSLRPGVEIGLERHPGTTQFFRVESGVGIAQIHDKYYALTDGIAFAVPPNALHNVANIGSEELKLYTIYSPPVHPSHTKEKEKP
jgi:mannose-6-phosphate isomerase-like protein (cupin superfamily)